MGRKRSAAAMIAGDLVALSGGGADAPLSGARGEPLDPESRSSRDPSSAQYTCPYCDRAFDDELAHLTHMREKHYRCRVCSRRLANVSSLAVHTRQVHKQDLTAVFGALPGRESVPLAIELERRHAAERDALNPSPQGLSHPLPPQPQSAAPGAVPSTWVSGDPSRMQPPPPPPPFMLPMLPVPMFGPGGFVLPIPGVPGPFPLAMGGAAAAGVPVPLAAALGGLAPPPMGVDGGVAVPSAAGGSAEVGGSLSTDDAAAAASAAAAPTLAEVLVWTNERESMEEARFRARQR